MILSDSLLIYKKVTRMKREGKGKMRTGMIITIPKKGELKIGLLKDALSKAKLNEEEFRKLLKEG